MNLWRRLRKEGRRRPAKLANKTQYAQRMQLYKHRDQVFCGRAALSWRTKSTCGALLCGFRGDPHFFLQRILVASAILSSCLGICSTYYIAPVPFKCEERCECLVEQLAGPQCEYSCERICREYHCDTAADDFLCAQGTREYCEADLGCGLYEPCERFYGSICPTFLILLPIGFLAEFLFWWLNKPHRDAIFGTTDSKVMGKLKQCVTCGKVMPVAPLDASGPKEPEPEPDPLADDEEMQDVRLKLVAELKCRGLVNRLHPWQGLDLKPVEGTAKEEGKYEITIASKAFRKMPFDVQRARMIKAVLTELGDPLEWDNLLVTTQTVKEWNTEREMENAAEKRATKKRTKGRLKFMIALSSAPTFFTVRRLRSSCVPYLILVTFSGASTVVAAILSMQFDSDTMQLWIFASAVAAFLKFFVFDALWALLTGPIWYNLKRNVPKWWSRCKKRVKKCITKPPPVLDELGDVTPERSSSEESDGDDIAHARAAAWEMYGGPPEEKKPPTPRPSTAELKAWADKAAAEADADRMAMKHLFKKKAIRTVNLPHHIDGTWGGVKAAQRARRLQMNLDEQRRLVQAEHDEVDADIARVKERKRQEEIDAIAARKEHAARLLRQNYLQKADTKTRAAALARSAMFKRRNASDEHGGHVIKGLVSNIREET